MRGTVAKRLRKYVRVLGNESNHNRKAKRIWMGTPRNKRGKLTSQIHKALAEVKPEACPHRVLKP